VNTGVEDLDISIALNISTGNFAGTFLADGQGFRALAMKLEWNLL
jgi:hypothetical protein